MNRLLSAALLAALLGAAPCAHAEAAAVDVVVHDPPATERHIALEWNPLPLFTIGKLSANVVVAPVDHHALVVSPFYAWTTTAGISIFDDSGTATVLPIESFKGFGAELGYRYYADRGGPRGLFVGPSLLLGAFQNTPQVGPTTHYLNLGGAVDVGYEVLVADRVALSLGGGLQYTAPSKSIPDQQFPANVYANAGLRPRLLLSLGWAL